MLGQETRDLGAMIVQQGYKSSFMILYGHSRLDRPNEKFCAILSNVEEVIEQKPAEKENRRKQRQDDKYHILFYASEAMSLDMCYSHIRAGDRCAIYAHIICVSENDSIGGLQVRIHLGAKHITFQ